MTLKALLWDVDGTLAETERDGHLPAFNRSFEALGLPWHWSESRYGELLTVAGGRERLLHDMQHSGLGPADPAEREVLAERLHHAKNRFYAELVAGGGLPLRPGVRELLADCAEQNLPIGIVTTTSRPNVDALLETQLGPGWESKFAAIVTAREAPVKKPDPQAYLIALQALDVRPHEAVAIEDSAPGVAATEAAGIPVIVTRSHYFPATQAPQGLAVGESLGSTDGWFPAAGPGRSRIDLEQIRRWYVGSRWARL